MSLDTEFASASASVREATPSQADPESQFMRLDGTTSARMRTLLDVEHGVPPGQDATVLSATLYLYKAESWSNSATVTLEPLSAPWDPYAVTWADQPGVRAASATVVVPTAGAIGDEITVDITSLVQTAVAADDAAASRWYGLRLSITATGQRLFYSPLGPEEYRPKLVREYNVPPDAPSNLIPNDQVVSEVKPLLVATFVDQDADDVISAIEVEIDDVDTFASLHYDSGKVSHTEASFDTNSPPSGAPVMTALTVGTTYYWRMRVWDGHDQVSAWSATASLVVTAKGTLTLTNPSGATVDTPVPTITHTFLGPNVTLATSAAADDIIDTTAAHGLAVGDRVQFSALTGGAGLSTATDYYVIAANLAATTFQVSTTLGGSAVNFTTDITAGTVAKHPQDEVEVEIEHLEDGVWFTHWELPRHVSTSLSHTVPDDYALEEGETYRVSVRVWDGEDRADLAGDRSFVEDSQEFSVVDST